MDIDRFITTNQAELGPARAARRRWRGGARFGPAEVDELVQLYQRASTHLSHARTQRRRPGARRPAHPAGGRRRRRRSTAPGPARWRGSPGSSPPASRPRCGTPGGSWWSAPLLLFVPAIAHGRRGWPAPTPPSRRPRPTPSGRPTSRRTSRPTTPRRRRREFATEVTVNNIQVGVPGLRRRDPPVRRRPRSSSSINGANVGQAGGLFAAVGQQPKFYGLILPHGLLELSAIVVAGGAGLRGRLGDHRPRRPHPRRRARRAGPPLGGDRARPGAGLRRGRHDRGLRHPERPARPSMRVGIGVAAVRSRSGPTSSSSAAAPPPRATPAPSASTSALERERARAATAWPRRPSTAARPVRAPPAARAASSPHR